MKPKVLIDITEPTEESFREYIVAFIEFGADSFKMDYFWDVVPAELEELEKKHLPELNAWIEGWRKRAEAYGMEFVVSDWLKQLIEQVEAGD
ncbi:MAG: hypothetical protein QW587_04870 [Candidatus Bathyarchaeia archaeon]